MENMQYIASVSFDISLLEYEQSHCSQNFQTLSLS
jgi:hypothetical protein